MLEKHEPGKQKSSAIGMDQISQALHDLCQPLTTLQCRLEIAQLGGTEQDYREAVELGLVDCDRLIESVGLLRRIVRESRSMETEKVGVRR
jgi:signal transduction histidine kinase